MMRVNLDVEMDRAAGRWGVFGYIEGAFEFEDGVRARRVGFWLCGGHCFVSWEEKRGVSWTETTGPEMGRGGIM